ncbi:hypothetical protein WISP_45848 [Willisornis vidua]|uniref:Uncharacterized protein n=1 Tax=Willisornis vidua TaxID=1566151 RepID=A0ABQ9DFH6_9PASS|nr:hypothetical protein WISP_45848 [Willisornis vidua]
MGCVDKSHTGMKPPGVKPPGVKPPGLSSNWGKDLENISKSDLYTKIRLPFVSGRKRKLRMMSLINTE